VLWCIHQVLGSFFLNHSVCFLAPWSCILLPSGALSAVVTQSGLCFKLHVLEYCDHLVQSVYLRMKPMPSVLLLGSIWLILSGLIVACLVAVICLKAVSVQLCILDVTISFCVCYYEIQRNRGLLLWVSVWGRNPIESVLASIEISFLVFQVIWNK